MKPELERVPIPGEHEATERSWAVVRAAFESRAPHRQARRRRALLPALTVAAAAAVLGIAVSPAGPALVHSVRRAVGLQHAAPALVRLPAAGRLLVDSSAGPWIVSPDGSKRLLGRYASAGWSPHGLFEVVAGRHELAALDPEGVVRWSLERRGPVHAARWSPDGYRIAYLDGASLRVVAGDGTGDRLLAARVAQVAPAWRPGGDHVLAYVTTAGAVRIVNTDTRAVLARRAGVARPGSLLWSADGALLLSLGRSALELRTATLAPVTSLRLPDTAPVAAAWAPHGRRYALVGYDARSDRSTVVIESVPGRAHTVFVGTGRVESATWSPDARWLLLAWRTADQWVFVPTSSEARLRAVAMISSQFHSRTFPLPAGWCC